MGMKNTTIQEGVVLTDIVTQIFFVVFYTALCVFLSDVGQLYRKKEK